MAATIEAESTGSASETPAVPWYSRKYNYLKSWKLLLVLLFAFICITNNIAPIWRLCWRYPIYSKVNFAQTTDTHGQKVDAWRWVVSREIRVYQLPQIITDCTTQVADGERALIHDAGLSFTVKVLPMPPSILQAYQASMVTQEVNGLRTPCIDFDKLTARLVELRQGDPHADVLIINIPVADNTWVLGYTDFNHGLCLIEQIDGSQPGLLYHLGKHEVCHLLGYMRHDDYPFFVFGYRGEGNPYTRDTLMMISGQNNMLSPRAKDALHAFWQGMETRMGEKFLR